MSAERLLFSDVHGRPSEKILIAKDSMPDANSSRSGPPQRCWRLKTCLPNAKRFRRGRASINRALAVLFRVSLGKPPKHSVLVRKVGEFIEVQIRDRQIGGNARQL